MSLMEIHTLTIKRATVTQGTVGGQVVTYTTAARSGSPTSVKGRASVMSMREKLEFGVRGEKKGWKFLFPTDPQITLEDRIEFDYVPGQSETVKVVVGSHARVGQSAAAHHYRVIGETDTAET